MADKIERTEKKKRKWDVVGTEPVPVVDLQNPLIKDAARRIEQVAARINSYKLKEGTLMEFTKDIEINDLRARYLLTKQSFQHQLKIDTGAHVVTKGKYYPDIHLATEKDPPMYLHIEAPSKKSMDDAVNQIDHIIDHPNLPVHDGSLGALMGPSGRVPIGILHADALNLKAKIMGPSGTYVKHIQLETNCRLHLRGKGSGFIESTGQESREDIGNSDKEVNLAKKLCEDLLVSVRADVEKIVPRYISQAGNEGSGYNQYAIGSGKSFIIQAPPAPPREARPPTPEWIPPPPPDSPPQTGSASPKRNASSPGRKSLSPSRPPPPPPDN